jgi:hypothetical protein
MDEQHADDIGAQTPPSFALQSAFVRQYAGRHVRAGTPNAPARAHMPFPYGSVRRAHV